MSNVDHAAAIREMMDRLHRDGLMPGTETVDAVIGHADALAAQLRGARQFGTISDGALRLACDELEASYEALEKAEARYSNLLTDHEQEIDRRKEAEARAARLRSGLLSDDVIRAATKVVGRMERTNGPDPNGYIRYTARDYAEAAITAALHVVGVSRDRNEPEEWS